MMYVFLIVLPGNSGGTEIEIRCHRIWSAALVSLTLIVEVIHLAYASRVMCSHNTLHPTDAEILGGAPCFLEKVQIWHLRAKLMNSIHCTY